MKILLRKLLPLLFSLALLLSLAPAALAQEPEGGEESLIDEDRLNQWMDDYLKAHDLEHSWQDVSVGFCYTATGDCWYYNADVFMYSASLYKVPVCMLIAEKEAAGDVTPETRIQGSTLQYLESSALTYSNNDSGHVLVSYLGGSYQGKCSDMSIPYTSLAEGYFVQDFFDLSYFSARYMTQLMQTLYEGGEERFPHVIEYLLPAQPGEYLKLTLGDKYEVAQKYGAFAEKNGNNNNHIAAIVYTPTPVIITVMTRNVGDYQWRIAEIGAYLADYSLELDGKLAERERQAAEQRPGLIPSLPAEIGLGEAPALAPEEPAQAAAPVLPQRQSFTPGAQIRGGREALMPAFYVMCAAALATAALAAWLVWKERRRQPVRTASGRANAARRARH